MTSLMDGHFELPSGPDEKEDLGSRNDYVGDESSSSSSEHYNDYIGDESALSSYEHYTVVQGRAEKKKEKLPEESKEKHKNVVRIKL